MSPLARADHNPVTRATAPVGVQWAHNRTPAPPGAGYGQDVEPAGRYLSEVTPGSHFPADRYDTGHVVFTNPLSIPFGGGYDEPDNWKRVLSARYGGKTGQALSMAIMDDGHDAVFTYDKYGTSEMVDLVDVVKHPRTVTPAQALNGMRSAYPDVDLWISQSPSGHVVVSKIVVPKENRQQGIGTRIMDDLCATADRQGWTLALTPDASFGGSKARLEKFYRRFGFVSNSGRNKDYSTSETFLRAPAR